MQKRLIEFSVRFPCRLPDDLSDEQISTMLNRRIAGFPKRFSDLAKLAAKTGEDWPVTVRAVPHDEEHDE